MSPLSIVAFDRAAVVIEAMRVRAHEDQVALARTSLQRCAPSTVIASGFSISRCLPAAATARPMSTCVSFGVHTMHAGDVGPCQEVGDTGGPAGAVDPRTAARARVGRRGRPRRRGARRAVCAMRRQVHVGDEAGADDADAQAHSAKTSRAMLVVATRSAPASWYRPRAYAASRSGASVPKSNLSRPTRRTTSRTTGQIRKRGANSR